MLSTIGVTSQSGATAKQVTFDQIASKHWQCVKLGFGAEGSATLVSSADPFPVAEKGAAAASMPALVSDGAATSLLRDRSGRIVIAEGLHEDKLVSSDTSSGSTTAIFAAQGAGYVSWLKHLHLKNLGRQWRVTCTIGSYEFVLDPGEDANVILPAKVLASSDNAALNLVVSPSTAKVQFNACGYKDRA